VRSYIARLTPVPRELIKIHPPVPDIGTPEVFQHHNMLDVFMIMVLASC